MSQFAYFFHQQAYSYVVSCMYIILLHNCFVCVNLYGEETLRKMPEQPSGDPFDDSEGNISIGKPIMGQNKASPYPELAQGCPANDFLRK